MDRQKMIHSLSLKPGSPVNTILMTSTMPDEEEQTRQIVVWLKKYLPCPMSLLPTDHFLAPFSMIRCLMCLNSAASEESVRATPATINQNMGRVHLARWDICMCLKPPKSLQLVLALSLAFIFAQLSDGNSLAKSTFPSEHAACKGVVPSWEHQDQYSLYQVLSSIIHNNRTINHFGLHCIA
eukprot:scaffold1767_cov178-Ochromonas_danica.AAC.19